MKKTNKAEQIFSDCVKFVFSDKEPEELAILIQHIKTEFKKELEESTKELEKGIPEFIFKAMVTNMLFNVLTVEYTSTLEKE